MNQTTPLSNGQAVKDPSTNHSIEIPLSEEEHAALLQIADMHNTSPHGILLHFGLRDVITRALKTRGKFDRALGEKTWEGQS